MQYKIILFVVLIMHFGCSKNQSEIDLLNKVDPVGFYGNHPPKGLIYSVDELLSSSKDKLGSDILVTGIITEVCPMRGCWLQVKDDNSDSSIELRSQMVRLYFHYQQKGETSLRKVYSPN